MRKFFKIVLVTLIIFLSVIVLGFILLQFQSVQTFLGHKASSYLSNKMNAEVSVGSVNIDLWDLIHLENVLVKDQKGDTLIYINDLNTTTFSVDKDKRIIELSKVKLVQPEFKMAIHNEDTTHNLQFLIDFFKTENSSNPIWQINFQTVEIEKGIFQYFNHNYSDSLQHTFNSRRIAIQDINGTFSDFQLIGDSISSTTDDLSLTEKSGFEIKRLAATFNISPSGILLTKSYIQSNNSTISGDIVLQTKSFSDYSKYIHKVKHQVDLKNTSINLADLNYFSKDNNIKDFIIDLDGKFRGRIDRLKGKNVNAKFGNSSSFKGNLSLNGLPNINKTFLDITIDQLISSKADIQDKIIPAFTNSPIALASNLDKLGEFTFTGDFTGFMNDFVTYGSLQTAIGNLETDLEFKETNTPEKYTYSGELKTVGFDLSELYNNKKLGKFSSSIQVEGKGLTRDLASLELTGNVSSIELGDLNFKDISINGNLENNFFSGQLISKDPNADLVFSGDIDFRNEIPIYSFTSDITNLNLKDHLPENVKIENISTQLSIEAKGSTPDDLEGEICMENVKLITSGKELTFESIFIHSSLDPVRVFTVETDILDGELKGEFSMNQLINVGKEIAEDFTPIIQSDSLIGKPTFSLDLLIKQFDDIDEIVEKDIYLSSGTTLNIDYNQDNISLSINADTVSYENSLLTDVDMKYENIFDLLSIDVSSSKIAIGDGFKIKLPRLTSTTVEDQLETTFSWNNGEENTSGIIDFSYGLDSLNYELIFNEGNLQIGPVNWQIQNGGTISSDGTSLAFNDLTIQNEDEKVYISGGLEENENTNVILDNLDISTINFFTPSGTTQVKGTLDGQLQITDEINGTGTYSNFKLSGLELEGIRLGDISSKGKWNSTKKAFELEGALHSENKTPLSFTGNYAPFDEENTLDFTINTDELQLDFLSAIVKDAVSDFGGSLSGNVDVKGNLSAPLLNGELFFNDAEVKIDYLNTSYTIKDGIGIRPDMFILENVEIIDSEGHSGHLIGSVIHTNFRKWSYDIFLDIEKDPFICINTTEDLNELFYGKGYATGFISIFGYDDFLEINANAKTEKGTQINMPLGDSEDIKFEDFVSFVSNEKDTLSGGLAQLQSEFDLTIDLEIDVTENAVFQMVFDQVTGDVLKGRGEGHLSLIVDNNSDFNMYGSLSVIEGDYLFTLQNLINKEFQIKPRGTINWYGDPFLADINLNAVYSLSAPLYDILGSSGDSESYKKRVPVELAMNLNGKLLNPGIAFEIDLPTSDEITKGRVNSIISTEQERNRQAFSLLVLKKFLPSTNFQGVGHSQLGLAENSTEFLSSQLNNWLSQITDEVDIGLNFRPGDEISSQEIALALSTQLFSDKLFISGNLGVTRGNETNHNPNTIIGDVRLEYLLGKDGKIRLLVYNDTNNFDINSTSYQTTSTQGVGIIYKEEFDSWEEFSQQFKSLLKGKKGL